MRIARSNALTPEGLGGRALSVDAPGRLPNLIVIGSMRSATSYIASKLRTHPDIFMSPTKELHYFNRWYDRGAEWYMRNFAGARDESVVGEATPEYMHAQSATRRIAELVPDAKLIALLRNPIDRAYSHYLKEQAWMWEPLSFADAIAAEPARLVHATEVRRDRYAYLDKSRYLPQLERVCQYFSREQLHVVIFEELHADPEATFRRIFEFLGVDPEFVPQNLRARVGSHKTLRSRGLHKALGRLPASRMRRGLQKLNIRSEVPPPMDPAIRTRLREEFAEHNAALARWLGRDLEVWNR